MARQANVHLITAPQIRVCRRGKWDCNFGWQLPIVMSVGASRSDAFRVRDVSCGSRRRVGHAFTGAAETVRR